MRPVGWWGLLSVVPLLAGCLGGAGGSDEAGPGTTPSATYAVTAGIPVPEPPKLTSTLHFMDGQRLTTVEPDAYEPIRIPIFSAATGVVNGGQRDTLWNFTWPADVASIRGEAVLHVDVHGLVLNAPYAAEQGSFPFWCIYVEVYPASATLVERDEMNGGGCVEEPYIVPEGPRTLHIPFEIEGTGFAAGYLASVLVGAEAWFQDPDARVELLAGSIVQDSAVTFEGVGWPEGLEKVTLLTTTT